MMFLIISCWIWICWRSKKKRVENAQQIALACSRAINQEAIRGRVEDEVKKLITKLERGARNEL
jgi:cbb3-type cytochrome oxidase subunit 3